MTKLALPVTINVTPNGVSIEHPRGVLAMSEYSLRAQRLTSDLGLGEHTILTASDVDDLPTGVADDIAEAIN